MVAILDSAIFHKKTSLNHSESTWWWNPSWNLFMLDSDTAILDSNTLLSSLWFTQKHSSSTLTLTQTNSIWLKLIHSHLTWWWVPSCKSAILNSDILDSAILLKTLTPTNSIWLKVIHTDSTWWWWPSWIQSFSTKKLHSFILTQLDDGSHIEFCHIGCRHCHLGFKHLAIFSQIHSKTLFLHSDYDSN